MCMCVFVRSIFVFTSIDCMKIVRYLTWMILSSRCTSTCTWRDVQNDITLTHSNTQKKERFQRCRLYYYFSVKSNASSMGKKIYTLAHTQTKIHKFITKVKSVSVSIATVITSYYYSIKFFFSFALLINSLLLGARSITSWADEFMYQILLVYSYRMYWTHWTKFFDSSDMGYCITLLDKKAL